MPLSLLHSLGMGSLNSASSRFLRSRSLVSARYHHYLTRLTLAVFTLSYSVLQHQILQEMPIMGQVTVFRLGASSATRWHRKGSLLDSRVNEGVRPEVALRCRPPEAQDLVARSEIAPIATPLGIPQMVARCVFVQQILKLASRSRPTQKAQGRTSSFLLGPSSDIDITASLSIPRRMMAGA
jgi:hypothetical protein